MFLCEDGYSKISCRYFSLDGDYCVVDYSVQLVMLLIRLSTSKTMERQTMIGLAIGGFHS